MDGKWTVLSGWAVGIAALIVVFGAGFLTGRVLPAHHYERFGNSIDLFDTSTGHICDTQLGSPPDPFAAYGGHAISPPIGSANKDAAGSDPYAQYRVDPSAPKDANGFPIVKSPPTPNNPLGFPESPSASSTPSVTFPPCNR